MPTWIGLVVTSTLTLVALVERFYARFVPDVEVQKRQLRKVGVWTFYIVGSALQIGAVWKDANRPSPLSGSYVVRTAVDVTFAVLWFYAIFAYRLAIATWKVLDRYLGILNRHLDLIEKQKRHTDVVCETVYLLIERGNFDPETKAELRKHLTQEIDAAAAPSATKVSVGEPIKR